MKTLFVIASICSALSLVSCNYRIDKQTQGRDVVITQADIDSPDYMTVNAKVIAPKCLECHTNDSGNQGGINLEAYRAVRSAKALIRHTVETGSMPKNRPRLTASQKKLILVWIDKGMPEHKKPEEENSNPVQEPQPVAPAPNPPRDEYKLDFATINNKVIEPACVMCHTAETFKGKVNLENYAEVFKNLKATQKTIIDGSMPKKGFLTKVQKQLILTWISAGAPEISDKVWFPSMGELNAEAAAEQLKVAMGSAPPVEDEFVARGRYLFNLSSCNTCHTEDPNRPLGGGKPLVTPYGIFYAPNISSDAKTGIGEWTNKQFLRAMRKGIGPKGQRYFPSFPYTNYSKMTDEDILSIQAYIMSMPAVEEPNKPHELDFPYDQRWLLSVWRELNFNPVDTYNLENYKTAQGPYQTITEKDLLWNRGAYLVEGPLHCTQCHTPRGPLGGLLEEKWFSGSDVNGGNTPAPNLTPELTTGLGQWSRDTWMRFLNEGITPRGEKVSGEMWHVIKDATSVMTTHDKYAVIEYMMSLTPIKNKKAAVPSERKR